MNDFCANLAGGLLKSNPALSGAFFNVRPGNSVLNSLGVCANVDELLVRPSGLDCEPDCQHD